MAFAWSIWSRWYLAVTVALGKPQGEGAHEVPKRKQRGFLAGPLSRSWLPKAPLGMKHIDLRK